MTAETRAEQMLLVVGQACLLPVAIGRTYHDVLSVLAAEHVVDEYTTEVRAAWAGYRLRYRVEWVDGAPAGARRFVVAAPVLAAVCLTPVMGPVLGLLAPRALAQMDPPLIAGVMLVAANYVATAVPSLADIQRWRETTATQDVAARAA